MRTRLGERIDRLLPPGLPEDELIGARFLLRAWLIALPCLALSIAGYVANSAWGQVALASLLVMTSLVTVHALRRGAPLRRVTHGSLAMALLSFGGSTLVQTPADITNVAFLAVLPLIASFVLGAPAARGWVITIVVVGVVLLALAHAGISLPFRDEAPFVSHTINVVAMMVVVWLFAATFARVRAEALERARAADRAKSSFLATVSHEIRTPMNAVLGMTEIMLGEATDPVQRERLEVVKRSGARLVSLINDVLDVMKVEAHKLQIERAAFDLRVLVRDLELLYTAQASRRDIALSVTSDVPAGHVSGDPLRLAQVLGNLLDNAVKFTEHGRVTLRVSHTGARHLFVVEDTGVGIDPPTLAKLFTPFQQANEGTTRRHGGTGLGLALARSMVELMGGRLEVQSTPGQGTRFWFELELAESAVVVPDEATPGPSDVPNTRVLVVDDNPVNVAVARGLLLRAGCEVESATSGEEALSRVAGQRYGLVLMDLYMPDMDGIEVTRRLRAAGSSFVTPIVGLTASAIPEELEACRAAGMIDILTKPITSARIRAALVHAARPYDLEPVRADLHP